MHKEVKFHAVVNYKKMPIFATTLSIYTFAAQR